VNNEDICDLQGLFKIRKVIGLSDEEARYILNAERIVKRRDA